MAWSGLVWLGLVWFGLDWITYLHKEIVLPNIKSIPMGLMDVQMLFTCQKDKQNPLFLVSSLWLFGWFFFSNLLFPENRRVKICSFFLLKKRSFWLDWIYGARKGLNRSPGVLPVSCLTEIVLYVVCFRHIEYCMHRVNLLRHFGVKPILVFDGGLLPMKIEQENKRARYSPCFYNITLL